MELKSAMAAVDRKRISFKQSAVDLSAGPEYTAYSNSEVLLNVSNGEHLQIRKKWTSK